MAKKSYEAFVLCEGVFDLTFIEFFLKRKRGFKDARIGEGTRMPGVPGTLCRYLVDKEGYSYCLISTGSIDRFNNYFRDYVYPALKNKTNPFALFVVADADVSVEKSESKIRLKGFSLKNGSHANGTILSEFGFDISYVSFLRIVPKNAVGTMETVLLNSIRETDKELVASSETFINTLPDESRKYIPSDKLKRKAKLGVALTLLNPEYSVSELRKRFEKISLQTKAIV